MAKSSASNVVELKTAEKITVMDVNDKPHEYVSSNYGTTPENDILCVENEDGTFYHWPLSSVLYWSIANVKS